MQRVGRHKVKAIIVIVSFVSVTFISDHKRYKKELETIITPFE